MPSGFDLSSVSSGNLALAFLLVVFGAGLVAWLWPRQAKEPTRAEWISQNQAFARALDELERRINAETEERQLQIGVLSSGLNAVTRPELFRNASQGGETQRERAMADIAEIMQPQPPRMDLIAKRIAGEIDDAEWAERVARDPGLALLYEAKRTQAGYPDLPPEPVQAPETADAGAE